MVATRPPDPFHEECAEIDAGTSIPLSPRSIPRELGEFSAIQYFVGLCKVGAKDAC
jgi:hypothetical protein